MDDDVPEDEKWRRFRLLEELQEGIAAEISARYLGEKVDVLFEENVRGRWKGRTPTNKLVFVEAEEDLRGQVRQVGVTWTGPWSMQASLPRRSPEILPVEPHFRTSWMSGGNQAGSSQEPLQFVNAVKSE